MKKVQKQEVKKSKETRAFRMGGNLETYIHLDIPPALQLDIICGYGMKGSNGYRSLNFLPS